MINDQIRAELRRSAYEDREPFFECGYAAFLTACLWRNDSDSWLSVMDGYDVRVLFLLVAEALE